MTDVKPAWIAGAAAVTVLANEAIAGPLSPTAPITADPSAVAAVIDGAIAGASFPIACAASPAKTAADPNTSPTFAEPTPASALPRLPTSERRAFIAGIPFAVVVADTALNACPKSRIASAPWRINAGDFIIASTAPPAPTAAVAPASAPIPAVAISVPIPRALMGTFTPESAPPAESATPDAAEATLDTMPFSPMVPKMLPKELPEEPPVFPITRPKA